MGPENGVGGPEVLRWIVVAGAAIVLVGVADFTTFELSCVNGSVYLWMSGGSREVDDLTDLEGCWTGAWVGGFDCFWCGSMFFCDGGKSIPALDSVCFRCLRWGWGWSIDWRL